MRPPAPPQLPGDNDINDPQMTLVAHLTELRNRLLISIAVILLIFGGLFAFANDIYTLLAKPLTDLMPAGTTMIATSVTSPFMTPFKLTFVAAIFLAIPVLLHQVWCFISPGMYGHEKRLAAPLLISSILLFYIGVAFAYFLVLPVIFGFFSSVTPANVAMMTDISAYLDFVLALFLAFGFAFEIPIAIILLIWSGITTAQDLADKRPYVIVGCFVIGMVLTPPDVISQTLLALPMWLLFEAGVLCGRLIRRSRAEGDGDTSPTGGDTDTP